MTLSLSLARILDGLAGKCRERRNYQALSHLDAHLLRDIGLRREGRVIMPIHAEGSHAKGQARDRLAVPARGESPGQACVDDETPHCPHCGASLA
ncbi:DUF1127 domain-containing protein [Litchfieldella rifensis]|uniref:DUF1127 domain-containing protein n=1 Tax=Litchfieldella rifensis TaxID=762643 RepID=A0ABV7LLF5_9GAMM